MKKKRALQALLTMLFILCCIVMANLLEQCGFNMLSVQFWLGELCVWVSYICGALLNSKLVNKRTDG